MASPLAGWAAEGAFRADLEPLKDVLQSVLRPDVVGTTVPDRVTALAPESRSAGMGSDWYGIPMEAIVDQAGRIVLPKFIRDALGLLPGTKVDISPYGAGVQVVPAGRTARLVDEGGVLVSAGDTPVDDDILFGLIDAGRK